MSSLRSTLLTLVVSLAGTAAEPAKPNIVWIIGDDLGPELACYGYEGVRTPHLDRLAKQGTLFTNAFSTSPVCSASRSALITGRYQTSIGAHHHRTMAKKPLPEGVFPITHHLREAGYQCVNLKDKALGANGKLDFNFLADSPFDGNAIEGEKPFFMQVNFHEPHRTFREPGDPDSPFKMPPQYPDHPDIRADWAGYLKSVETFDAKVGKFLQWLEDEGHAENTAVFVFGDHGHPHVWGKQWLWDAGIRVPLIVRWPGVAEAGKVDDRLVSLIDLSKQAVYAACAAAQVEMPGGFHGHAFLAEDAPEHQYLFAARDRCGDAYDRIRCVRDKRYKYIRNFYPELPYWQTSRYKSVSYPSLAVLKQLQAKGKLNAVQARYFADRRPAEELYDLEADPHETNNLAADPEHAATLAKMRAALEEWIDYRGDLGATPEPLELYEKADASSLKAFRKRFTPDEWDKRSDEIRAALKARGLKPEAK